MNQDARFYIVWLADIGSCQSEIDGIYHSKKNAEQRLEQLNKDEPTMKHNITTEHFDD